MRPTIKHSNPFPGLIALVGLVSASSMSLAADSEATAMQKCQALQDREERLACYDGISSQAEPEVATVEVPPSTPKAPPSVAPVMEESLAKEEPGAAATTMNDEIGRRVPWKECDFEVTIKKDFFGYVMQRSGEKKEIRIARMK